jgi:hypothetical protein
MEKKRSSSGSDASPKRAAASQRAGGNKLLASFVRLLVVAQNQADFFVIIEKVFLEQGRTVCSKMPARRSMVASARMDRKIRVADAVLAVVEGLDAPVDAREHRGKVEPRDVDACKEALVGRHLHKIETPPQRGGR